MNIIEWVIQDTRRKQAAEEAGGGAAAVGPSALPPPDQPPVSISGTIDARAGRNSAGDRAAYLRERYRRMKGLD